MKVFLFSEARKKFAEVLNTARFEKVIVRRRNGESFIITKNNEPESPFDIDSIQTNISTEDIILAVRESRKDF